MVCTIVEHWFNFEELFPDLQVYKGFFDWLIRLANEQRHNRRIRINDFAICGKDFITHRDKDDFYHSLNSTETATSSFVSTMALVQTRYQNTRTKPIYIDVLPPPSNRGRFTTGNAIQGTVRVDPRQRPQRIVLNLIGRTKFGITKFSAGVGAAQVISQTVVLFYQRLDLFSSEGDTQSYDIVNMGNGIEEDGKIALYFEFKMPGRVERNSGLKFKEKHGFEMREGGVLPPSYFRMDSMCPRLVEYYLEALLYKRNKQEADDTVRQPILYCPPSTRVEEAAIGRYIPTATYLQTRGTRCQTEDLLPADERNTENGLLEKIKHRWRRDYLSTPHAVFRVLAKVPEKAIIGNVIPIELTLEHLERSPEVIDPPTIYLKEVRVSLTSALHVRVAHPSMLTGEDLSTTKETARDTFVIRFDQKKRQILYNGLKLEDLGMQRLDNVVPGFSSYGLYLQWGIQVKLIVQCANLDFNIEACNGPIAFLSGLRSSEDIENLPPYEPPQVMV